MALIGNVSYIGFATKVEYAWDCTIARKEITLYMLKLGFLFVAISFYKKHQ